MWNNGTLKLYFHFTSAAPLPLFHEKNATEAAGSYLITASGAFHSENVGIKQSRSEFGRGWLQKCKTCRWNSSSRGKRINRLLPVSVCRTTVQKCFNLRKVASSENVEKVQMFNCKLIFSHMFIPLYSHDCAARQRDKRCEPTDFYRPRLHETFVSPNETKSFSFDEMISEFMS